MSEYSIEMAVCDECYSLKRSEVGSKYGYYDLDSFIAIREANIAKSTKLCFCIEMDAFRACLCEEHLEEALERLREYGSK